MAPAELLASLREIARKEVRDLDSVLEDAIRQYIENYKSQGPREYVMGHFQTSVAKNRRLGELLAQ